MPSLSQASTLIRQALQGAGIEPTEARAESEIIIEHVTGMTLAQRLLSSEMELASDSWSQIEDIIESRKNRYPLQYCLGYGWFYGMKLTLSPAVLIPRPETEILVQHCYELLKPMSQPTFIDVGTGSGAIAIALLKLLPEAKAIAIDISRDALQVAQLNATIHQVNSRMSFEHIDWGHFKGSKVDAIIANPPYVPACLEAHLQPEVAIFEPREAIFGNGTEGTGFYELLAENAPGQLKSGGWLAVEVGEGQSTKVKQLFTNTCWTELETIKDLSAIERIICARRT